MDAKREIIAKLIAHTDDTFHADYTVDGLIHSCVPIATSEQLLDLVARFDALEKRLAKVCELATLTAENIKADDEPKPASEYIKKERAVEIANDWFPDDFGAARVGFHVAIATEPGANVVNEIEAATRVSFVDYNRGVADGRRKGVEAVAKWFNKLSSDDDPFGKDAADAIDDNIESILKEAGDES